MSFHSKTLITVVTESALELTLRDDFKKFGIKGYTIWDVRGSGQSGERDASWDESKNIRIEAICDETTAQDLARYLKETYYSNYAMVLFLYPVQVLRAEKF